ncbi:hypothetical protein DERF_014873 [Dermatophagoides farinae]|uniref:Uncharacterized protein n=1 Tax=Dermatophagoides farinae TaxID=6954 RepID=A0A922HN29_DERFA|nr:hypothetical protein DERF_014873 [Dermatophagoides farinae]
MNRKKTKITTASGGSLGSLVEEERKQMEPRSLRFGRFNQRLQPTTTEMDLFGDCSFVFSAASFGAFRAEDAKPRSIR